MNKLEGFEIVGQYAVFRTTGDVSLDQAVALVTSALRLARQQKVRKLLVDTTGLTGFVSPGLASRYFFVHEWAEAAGGGMRLAMVARPEMIDPEKFGVTVARNAGLINDVFVSEEEAIAWLLSET